MAAAVATVTATASAAEVACQQPLTLPPETIAKSAEVAKVVGASTAVRDGHTEAVAVAAVAAAAAVDSGGVPWGIPLAEGE